jgi:putative endonuclease
VGSTNIDLRLQQHQAGEVAIHSKKRLPIKLVYYEQFPGVHLVFDREEQV